MKLTMLIEPGFFLPLYLKFPGYSTVGRDLLQPF